MRYNRDDKGFSADARIGATLFSTGEYFVVCVLLGNKVNQSMIYMHCLNDVYIGVWSLVVPQKRAVPDWNSYHATWTVCLFQSVIE